MKVLILTISAGQGHNQTANAVHHYLSQKGVECKTLDAYQYINPILSEGVKHGYLLGTQYTPIVYGGFYRLAERRNADTRNYFTYVANALFGSKLFHYIEQFNPDYIVGTHIFVGTILTQLRKRLRGTKTIGIVTDFTAHPYWEETKLDYYVTASELLNNQMRKKGISQTRILPFGIPVNSKFSNKIEKREAKKLLGISDKPTILLVMGSMGFGNVASIVRKIDSLPIDFQVLAVCGKNKRAQRRIDKYPHKHQVYNYGFVDNIDIMMDAADFIITKPGGLTVSESMAKGLPLILVNPIPGQEDRNVEFLLNNGLALHVTNTFPVDEAIYQFFNNQFRRERFHETVKEFGKPNAAKDLGDFIIADYEKTKK